MIFSNRRFLQRTNKWIRLRRYMIPQVYLFLFVFWKNLKTPKTHFEIIWPLMGKANALSVYESNTILDQSKNILEKSENIFEKSKNILEKSKCFERSKQLEQVQDSFGSIEGQDIKVQLYKIIWKFENLNASL